MSLRTAATTIIALAAAATVAAAGTIALGDGVPLASTKMKNVDGREITIAEAAGDAGALVIFTCNACPWAKAWEERIVEIGNRFSGMGVGVIAINSNDPARNEEDGFDEMKRRAAKYGMKFPYVVDATSGVARAFGATRTPEAFLFDATGKLVYHGTIDDNARDPEAVTKRYLEDALEAVVAGKPVPLAETKALGCSIKYRG